MASNWSFVLAHTGTPLEEILDLSAASGRKLAIQLNDASSAQFSISGFDEEATWIRELETDLVVYRNGVRLFRGRIGSSEDAVDENGHAVSFSVWDYRELLNRRVLLGDTTERFKFVEQEEIGWTLIDEAQQQENGDMGITRGIAQNTNIIRDIAFETGQKVGEQIQALADSENGFEWEIDPDLIYRVYYPQRGNQESDYVLELGGAALAVKRNVDASEFANVVQLQGAEVKPEPPKRPSGRSQETGGYLSEDEKYRYGITAILPEGETPLSELKYVNVRHTSSDNSVRLDWDAVDRATGYNVYGRNRNEGPTNITATVETTGGYLRKNRTYQYGVSAVTPDGHTELREKSVNVEAAFDSSKVTLSWYPYPNATQYRIYGREDGETLELLGTTTSTSYTDNGLNDPSGLPQEPYHVKRIASNVQTTYYVDDGFSTPDGDPPPEGVSYKLSQTAFADDISVSPAGRWETNIGNTDLVLQPMVEKRSGWYLREHGVIRPSYSVKIDPAHWRGPEDLWVGDAPTLSIHSGRLSVETSDLRVISMEFDIGDEGEETITANLGRIPPNFFRRVNRVRSRLDSLERR